MVRYVASTCGMRSCTITVSSGHLPACEFRAGNHLFDPERLRLPAGHAGRSQPLIHLVPVIGMRIGVFAGCPAADAAVDHDHVRVDIRFL